MARLTPLPVPVPGTLEALLGYEGDAEWLALYVDASTGEVVGDEGYLPFVLAEDAYRLYTDHRAVASHLTPFDLGAPGRAAHDHLVLNRLTRTLYVARARAARAHVRAQWSELPPSPKGAEVGTILAQWTWRLRAEASPAGQAKRAADEAIRPRDLQALRAWLDTQRPHLRALSAGAVAEGHDHETRGEEL